MRTIYACVLILALPAASIRGQIPYQAPPPEVVTIIDAPPTPMVRISPKGDALALVEYVPHPPIAFLARPFLRIAGIRIDPERHSARRVTIHTGITIRWTARPNPVRIALPRDSHIGLPQWSHDGSKLAFRRDVPAGVELWVADPATGTARRVRGLRLNDVLAQPFSWLADNTRLLVFSVPRGIGKPPEAPTIPAGPVVEESAGKRSRMATYQDLLKIPSEERTFEYFATSQLAVVNAATGEVKTVGKPGIYLSADFSPDERFLLVTRVVRPFSYRVPYYYFTRRVEVWDRYGTSIAVVADLPVSDEIPVQGVPVGPRNVEWQPMQAATLVWVEALDGGDPQKRVPHRDRVMRQVAPCATPAVEMIKVQHRFRGIAWTATSNEGLLMEYDRDRRWTTTSLVTFSAPFEARKVIFDLSTNDAYNHPGSPVYDVRPDGEAVVAKDGDWVYFSSEGATPQGYRPFLHRVNLRTLEREPLFRSGEERYEEFVGFASRDHRSLIIRSESPTDPPNYCTVPVGGGSRTILTEFKDPAPQLTSTKKQLVKYNRPDGVSLSGTLYLPPGYTAGTRMPLVVWAYPLEYSDAGTAGQVRAAPNRFTFYRGASPLFFLTQGYAVLMDATMPVVGDPETMNDSFIEQIVAAGKSAIDKMDSMGVADPKRVLVMGHSYGAFMTANLLAHCDWFAAGIARSGAYNRSLTPFGFQSERRSFWEAPDVYVRVSPFTHAHKINEPILLIHGEADNNPGAYPLQSERMYQALQGNGATVRLVMLPFEGHGYAARESVLHTLAEMFAWAEKYVKARK